MTLPTEVLDNPGCGRTVDEPDHFARRITHLRAYLGVYTRTFRTNDTVHVAGKLVHFRLRHHAGFGVELPLEHRHLLPGNLTA